MAILAVSHHYKPALQYFGMADIACRHRTLSALGVNGDATGHHRKGNDGDHGLLGVLRVDEMIQGTLAL